MDEYRVSYEFHYSDPCFWGMQQGARVSSDSNSGRVHAETVLSPDKISRTHSMMEDAMAFKVLSAPLSKDQLVDLIQILATQ